MHRPVFVIMMSNFDAYFGDKATVATKGTNRPSAVKPVLCLVILVFCLALAAAVGVTVYFLIGGETSDVKRERFVGTVTLDRPWNEALVDSSSAAYRSLENEICVALTSAIAQETHDCAVTSFEQGSIKGHFVTLVSVNSLDDLDTVTAKYREGITVSGQAASVEVVVDPGNGEGEVEDGEHEDKLFQGLLAADGAYRANWTSDNETITVTIVGRTRGWVGFGISGTGGMKEADIMMAWVDDSGTGHIVDTNAEENGVPVVDTFSQDWKLLEASEDGTSTKVTVRRFLRVCDTRNRNFTSGTMKMIWALGERDPTSESSLSGADYHGSLRGTASRRLLDPPGPPPVLPDDAISVDFVQENVTIPSDKDTTYWCRLVPLPAMDRKHHFIMVEPVVKKGNELYVHHTLLYVCHDTENAHSSLFANEGIDCERGIARRYCTYVLSAWAVGGTAQYLPRHVGIPLGGADSPQYLMLESHYDNPHFHAGVVDNSGLRMWLTPSLRQYDASVLWAGMDVNPLHFVPAGVENFITAGHCTEECLNQGLADLDNGIHIFAGFLHTHLAGVSVVVRHIRNGTELPPIMEDKTYDFDYQNVVFLDEEVTVLPGDRLIVECGYTTKDRNETTYGGLGTYDEMCLAFLYHYPVMAVKQCTSLPTIPQLVKAIPGAEVYYNGYQYYFSAPAELDGYPVMWAFQQRFSNVPGAADALQSVNRDGIIRSHCSTEDDYEFPYKVTPPVETPYTETLPQCNVGTVGLPDN